MDTSSSSNDTPGSASASADSVTQTGTDERDNEASSIDQRPCIKKARYACTFHPESSKFAEEFMDFCTSDLSLELHHTSGTAVDAYWNEVGQVRDVTGHQ